MQTILLDTAAWDLVLDANGNIAVASEPYSLSQDAASAIKTFLGEAYWDTTIGVPWIQSILGMRPSLPLLKEQLIAAALTVTDVSAATVFITDFTNRTLSGQVQVTSATTQQVSAANFTVINPQAF
jgi:hypothetical protein